MSKQRRDHTHSAQLTTRSSCLLSTQTSARTGARPSTPPSGPRFVDDPAATRRDLAAQVRALGVDPDHVEPAIDAAWEAWEIVPGGAFVGTTRREHLAALVRGGWFARLVQACAGGRGPDAVVALVLVDPSLSRLKNLRQIAMHWAAPLRVARAPDAASCVDRGHRDDAPAALAPPRMHLHFARVDRQLAVITERMVRRDGARVEEYVEQLIALQLQARDGVKYAVRSLHDLAERAESSGLRRLQLWLTGRALALSPDDGGPRQEHCSELRRASRRENDLRLAQRANARLGHEGAPDSAAP